MQTVNSIKDIFLSDAKFSKTYLSLHYPFTEQQIYDLGEYLHWGSAHYSVYLNDTGSIYSPGYGLCYNPNIQWTDDLKRMWSIGFWNPFVGYYEGLPDGAIEYDEMAGRVKDVSLFSLIPLDLHSDLNDRETLCYQAASSTGDRSWLEPDFKGFYGEEVENKPYGKLTDAEFIELYNKNPLIILYNTSIWNNTLCELFTADFMHLLIDKIKQEIGATERRISTQGYMECPPPESPLIEEEIVLLEE